MKELKGAGSGERDSGKKLYVRSSIEVRVRASEKLINIMRKMSRLKIVRTYGTSSDHVLMNERINLTRENIKILHYYSWTMENYKFVSKTFLEPTTDLVNITVVF